MFDRARLTEAASGAASTLNDRRVVLVQAERDWVLTLIEAARLLSTGEDVDWCEAHNLQAIDGECEAYLTAALPQPCRMVEAVIVLPEREKR